MTERLYSLLSMHITRQLRGVETFRDKLQLFRQCPPLDFSKTSRLHDLISNCIFIKRDYFARYKKIYCANVDRFTIKCVINLSRRDRSGILID